MKAPGFSPRHPALGIAVLIAGLCLGPAHSARADSCTYTGNNHDLLDSSFHNIGLTVCSTHFASGSAERDALQFALDRLNDVQWSDLYFYIAGTDSHHDYDDTLVEDGYNRIDITEQGCDASGDCSFDGRTAPWDGASGNIEEFDIAFSEDTTWAFGDPTSWALSDGYTYFRTVALHELGHGIGFEHSSTDVDVLSIMGGRTGKWNANKRVGLKAFDHGHIRFHYSDGSTNGEPDLLLSNYWTSWDGSSYACDLDDGLSATSVARGGSVTLTWTRMNTGPVAVTDTYYTRVYLSTDETISSGDYNVKTWYHTGSVAASSTLYSSTTLTIPTSYATGTYYVLMYIDSDGDVAEYGENNNTMPIHEQLTIY